MFGVDSTLAFYTNLSINAYWATTRTNGLVGDNSSYRAQLDYNGDRYGVQAEHLGLDAHVGVATYEHHLGAGLHAVPHPHRDAEDGVVRVVQCTSEQLAVISDFPALHAQRAAAWERYARPEVPLLAKRVELPGNGARGAATFVQLALELVELLDHRDRQHQIVFVEHEERPGIVEEHVGVKDVGALAGAVYRRRGQGMLQGGEGGNRGGGGLRQPQGMATV